MSARQPFNESSVQGHRVRRHKTPKECLTEIANRIEAGE